MYKTIAAALNAANSKLRNETRVGLKLPEVGKVQLEAAISAIAEVALHFNFFLKH